MRDDDDLDQMNGSQWRQNEGTIYHESNIN